MDAPVLLTGATGYIGGRLLRHFEEAGRPVRCLARNPERVRATRSTTEVVRGALIQWAADGIDSVFISSVVRARRRFRWIELVDQTGVSWNQILRWLTQIEALRSAA